MLVDEVAGYYICTGKDQETVILGKYRPDGGSEGEFTISWVYTDEGVSIPSLYAFDTSWDVIQDLESAIDRLIGHDIFLPVTPYQIKALLKSLNFTELHFEENANV